MRILLSTDAVGGVWDYSLALAGGLRERGHTVMLAVVGDAPADRLRAVPEGVEVQQRPFLLEWMPGAEADVEAAGRWLAARSREWRADVAHLNQLAYAVHPFGAPTVAVLHSDVLSWFAETHGTAAPPEWDAYARWVGAGIAAADSVVAISRYASALSARHFGRAADRVIHNGVQPPAAAEPAPRAAPLVLSAGRAWDEAKGMDVLDRALERLGDAAPEAHLFGELRGPHGQRFEPQRLVAHGRAPRAAVDGWMERASVYVGASRYEPFGLAPLEAAMRGCALVLSDLPVFRELWDGCAVFFARGDAASLAAALEELAPDLARCSALGLAARRHALERFTARRMVDGYEALYRALAPRPPLSSPDARRG